MNWLIYHIASGQAFFSGSAMLLAASVFVFSRRSWVRRLASLLCIVGVIFIAVSSTPLSLWYYIPAGLVTIVWLGSTRWQLKYPNWNLAVRIALPAAVLFGVILEIPHHLLPAIETEPSKTVIVFGDSVTAGLGDDAVETWPQILERTRSITIQDYAKIGATVSTAVQQVRQQDIPEGLVFLEIGGNDVLGSTSPEKFREDLKELFEALSSHRGQIVMMELPLPPFFNSYGRIQRELAREYNVKLIPKRIFMRILAQDQSTLDSIHLSQSGQQQFADAVWEIVGGAFDEN